MKKSPINKLIIFSLFSFFLHYWATAQPSSFNFKDPKGVNHATFNLDAPLESISGSASGVSGTVLFDPNAPEEISGEITIDAGSLIVPNDSMQQHLHGNQWLDTKKYPSITFTVKKVSEGITAQNGIQLKTTGIFTLKGKSKEITVPVAFVYLPGKLTARSNGKMKGDLLVIRSQFSINRSDFSIKPGQHLDKVSEQIDVKLSVAGYCEKR